MFSLRTFCSLLILIKMSTCASIPPESPLVTLSVSKSMLKRPAATLQTLSSHKRFFGWLTFADTFKLIPRDSIADALKEIDEQRKELKLAESVGGSVDANLLKAAAQEILGRVVGAPRNLEEWEIEKVKKWYLACKLQSKLDPSCPETNNSVAWDAISFLQSDPILLQEQSQRVKVFRWPKSLNLGHFISADPLHDLAEAQNTFDFRLQQIYREMRRGMKDRLQQQQQQWEEEMLLREDVLRLFTKLPKGSAKLTLPDFLDRLRAFDYLVAVHLKLRRGSNVKLMRIWLLVHQMLYELDGVSESGGFTREWPVRIEAETIEKERDRDNVFFSRPEPTIQQQQEQQQEPPLFPALSAKLKSIKSARNSIAGTVSGFVTSLFGSGSGASTKEASASASGDNGTIANTPAASNTLAETANTKTTSSVFSGWFSSK